MEFEQEYRGLRMYKLGMLYAMLQKGLNHNLLNIILYVTIANAVYNSRNECSNADVIEK